MFISEKGIINNTDFEKNPTLKECIRRKKIRLLHNLRTTQVLIAISAIMLYLASMIITFSNQQIYIGLGIELLSLVLVYLLLYFSEYMLKNRKILFFRISRNKLLSAILFRKYHADMTVIAMALIGCENYLITCKVESIGIGHGILMALCCTFGIINIIKAASIDLKFIRKEYEFADRVTRNNSED